MGSKCDWIVGAKGENAMAQAEAFETDFWKHTNLRKVRDDIVPGVPRKTIPYMLINSFALSSYPREAAQREGPRA